MSEAWQQIGSVAPGGTVFGMAMDHTGRHWLATEAGLFLQQAAEGWLALPHGQPLPQLSAMTCAGRTLLAGNGQGEIVYTTDGGQQWYQSRIVQSDKPISWLVASPNFERDRVLLAGTNGAGVLRSTDGGRNWRLTNFGLRDFSVLALAVAPTWGRREFVFAATLDGFYRSPNGGRAWKKADAGLEGTGVQAIAVSPAFAEDNTLFVGTESGGVFRSTDRGQSWQPCQNGLSTGGALPSINCLWLHPEFAATPVMLAGSAEGQIFRSVDSGQSWQPVAEGHAVLCFGGDDHHLYAGLHEAGLLTSTDGGQRWVTDTTLNARPLTRLLGHGRQLFAYGPWEDVWRSADDARTWAKVADLDDYRPLFTLAASVEGLLLGTNEGLLRSEDGGQTWRVVLETEHGQVATILISPESGHCWVGTSSGALLTSTDDGLTWQGVNAPQPGLPLLEVARLPATVIDRHRSGHILAVATLNPANGQVTLWHSSPQKIEWTQWMQAKAHWPSVYLTGVGETPARAVAGVDRRGWRTSAAGWERIIETERPIGRLLPVASNGLLALAGRQLLRSTDSGASWADFDEGLVGYVLQDVTLSAAGETAYLLSTGGLVWRRRIPVK